MVCPMVRNRTSTGFLECAVGVAQSNYSRGVAQWLTRNVRDLEVGGSNPPPPDGARPLNVSRTQRPGSKIPARHYLTGSKRPTVDVALKYQKAQEGAPVSPPVHNELPVASTTAETQPFSSA